MSNSGKLDFKHLKLAFLTIPSEDDQQINTKVKQVAQKKRLRKIQESDSETE